MIMAALYGVVPQVRAVRRPGRAAGTQDPATAFRAHMKLASGGHLDDLDQTSFFAQGQEYDDAGDLRDSVLKLLLIEGRTHPFAVVRASELRRWVDSGDYTRPRRHLPRRDDDADARSARPPGGGPQLPETFRDSQDALGKLVHDAAGCSARQAVARRAAAPRRRLSAERDDPALRGPGVVMCCSRTSRTFVGCHRSERSSGSGPR